MRCPSCGARNPEDARWCGQCLASLVEEPEPAGGPSDSEPSPSESDDNVLRPAQVPHDPSAPVEKEPASGADDVQPLQAGGGRFRRHDGEIEWRCEACESWNVVGLARCSVCGTGMAGPEPAPRVDERATPAMAIGLSVLLPGAGHAALGLMATAWARGLTYLLWLLGGVSLVVSALQSSESVLPGLTLLLGALILWAITLLDVRLLTAGQTRQILDARVFLWLVVGVVGLLMLTFMSTFSRVGGGTG